MKYGTIYADPPWNEAGGGKIRRGADRHYKLMKTADIAALPIRHLAADDAHLYLWVTNGHLPDGLRVMDAWGFRYVTNIAWAKDRFGLGQYYRGQHELCLFGVRGRVPYRKLPSGKRAQGRTLIAAPRRAHSEKPEEMRGMIEVVSPGPYVELFARRQTEGWDTWGDEVFSSIQLPTYCERCKVWHEGGPAITEETVVHTMAEQIREEIDRELLEEVSKMCPSPKPGTYCGKHLGFVHPCPQCAKGVDPEAPADPI